MTQQERTPSDLDWLRIVAAHFIPKGWLLSGYTAARLTAKGWITATLVFGDAYTPELTAAGRQELANAG